ncbi:hypothetical protein BBJ29_006150 [Phytophthora kernoviae]|uniref:Pseudouridine synthase I TruA alpha/beta domain-containing protein n=1 Tax=Phytophthora kernoviae TaxID=325452 RepID=A0A3R7N7N3_9STRA|nr:hypothetical protein BBJ29_006150 [Phytophthora kernoviae]
MLSRFALNGARRRAIRSPLLTLSRGFTEASSIDTDTTTGRRGSCLASTSSTKLVKRKVAIVGGYMGTGYHGLQLNKDVQTIEDELRTAIFKAGAMRESNFEDLGKIDWSRSSRTDKGVHAGCIVFSGKLLIDEENQVDPTTGRVKGLTEALNASLPSNIRVFSCTRVNKRFSARKNCALREYEYFLPLSFLKECLVESGKIDADSLNMDEAIVEFGRALRRYEGVHDFHNFTRSRSYFYKVQAKMMQWKAQRDAFDTDDGGDDQDDLSEIAESDEEEESTGDDFAEDMSQFGDEEGLTRKLLPRHRRSIYSCTGTLISDFSGKQFLRVHIVGQAFLLNQIRCMIGGALAVATKGMSRTAFDAALSTNRIVRVPIAPAEGLVLLSSTFGGKLHTVSLYEDPNTSLAKERKDLVHRILLDHREDEEMTKFREEVIYTEVASSWNKNEDMDRWRAYLERCYESNKHLDEDELAILLYELDQANERKRSRSQSYVRQNRIDLAENGRGGALLPRQFTTKLCIRYNVAPGIFTSDLRRAVARHLRSGKIPCDADEDQIMAYIDSYGSENLAEEGRKLRLSIRTEE